MLWPGERLLRRAWPRAGDRGRPLRRFPTCGQAAGDGGAGHARERAADRRARRNRGRRSHRLACPGVTQDLSVWRGQGRKRAVFFAETALRRPWTWVRTIRLAPGGTYMTLQTVRPTARKALIAATAAFLATGLSIPQLLAQTQPGSPAVAAPEAQPPAATQPQGLPPMQGPASVADLAAGLLDAVVNISTSQTVKGAENPDSVPVPQLP